MMPKPSHRVMSRRTKAGKVARDMSERGKNPAMDTTVLVVQSARHSRGFTDACLGTPEAIKMEHSLDNEISWQSPQWQIPIAMFTCTWEYPVGFTILG